MCGGRVGGCGRLVLAAASPCTVASGPVWLGFRDLKRALQQGLPCGSAGLWFFSVLCFPQCAQAGAVLGAALVSVHARVIRL